MGEFLVFALIGLFAGATARLWYPGREPMKVVGSMLLGMVGSLLGGLIAWSVWTPADGKLYPVALLTSLLGGAVLLVVWPIVAYVRKSKAAANFIP